MNERFRVAEDLSDPELLVEVSRLAASERKAIAELVSALAELEARRLYLGQGCSSMLAYCTQVLHLAEHAAFNRIEAARAARRFPIIFEQLADGRIPLSAVRLLAPHLADANHQSLLREASHKSKREVEQIVARILPQPEVATSVRKLPSKRVPEPVLLAPTKEPASGQTDTQPFVATTKAQRSKAEPLAPGRFKVQFTVGEATYLKLRRVQDLLRHRLPSGDLSDIFDRALTMHLGDLEKSKLAATERPRISRTSNKRSRSVPAEIRRAVWARDGGRCRFEGPAGRCSETGLLEFHHVVPYAQGGPTTADNLELRCAAHNRYEAEQCFGLFVRESTAMYRSDRERPSDLWRGRERYEFRAEATRSDALPGWC